MSRKKTRKQTPAQTLASESGQDKRVQFSRWLLIPLCLLPAVYFFTFGKILEFKTPGAFDSGAYVYSAQHLLDGARLGVDEKTTAQPATLLMNVIGVRLFGFNDTGPKVMQMILQLIGLGMIGWALLKLWGRTAAVTAVTVAAFYLSAPHIAKYGNVKEQFMISFMLTGIASWILYEMTGKKGFCFLTGAALIWPYYFKATGLSAGIALVLYLLVRTAWKAACRKTLAADLLRLIVGAAVGILPLAGFMLWQHQIGNLLISFPFFAFRLFLITVVLYFAVRFGIIAAGAIQLPSHLRRVHPAVWIIGLPAICLMLGYWIIYFSRIDEFRYYWNSLFFVRFYHFVAFHIQSIMTQLSRYAGGEYGYLAGSHQEYSLSKQAPIVWRFYLSIAVPFFAGLAGLLFTTGLGAANLVKKQKEIPLPRRLSFLLTVYFVLDAAFTWISPRSYEEYYLPMAASGSLLAGFLIWLCLDFFSHRNKPASWLLTGGLILVMICLAWPIYFGLRISPFTGAVYKNSKTGQVAPSRGYVQTWNDRIHSQTGMEWVKAGKFIHQHTQPDDTIYVWGWYPGIYVAAQRMAPIPQAFESNMHIVSPYYLRVSIRRMAEQFRKCPPRFIVDTRKRHFPWDRPPLELWPQIPRDNRTFELLPNHPLAIKQYETQYAKLLAEKVNPQEAERFEAMKPLRDLVMNHYKLVKQYGPLMLYEYEDTLKSAAGRETEEK